MTDKPNKTLPGRVEKIMPASHSRETEMAQIELEDGDDLYKEIRVDNTLEDEEGNQVRLKKGVKVDVIVEADKKDTEPKADANGDKVGEASNR